MRTVTVARERNLAGQRVATALLVVAAFGLTFLPFWADNSKMRPVIEFCYYLALAQAWNLLAGYAGVISVGQQAFVGVGGYAFFAATVFGGVSPLLALPLAGLVAGCVAAPAALLMFRLQGAYLAIGTWALAEVFRTLFTVTKVFGAGTGVSLPIAIVRQVAGDRATRDLIVYYIALGIGFGSVAFVFALLRSRAGLALTAIRDSEVAAASVGVDQRRIKLGVYMAVAFIAGLVGALVLMQKLRINPSAAFSVLDWSANVIFIVVIGGIGTVEGPIIGAIAFFLLRALLADYGAWYLVTLGILAIVAMIWAPNGIWGYIIDNFGVHIFPVRRRAYPESAEATFPKNE